MKNRIKVMSNFGSEIRNDPFKSLETVKEKMHDPARAKCELASLTETMTRVLIGAEQGLNEDLIDFAGRFKQARDTGDKASHVFVKTTKEWQDKCNEANTR